MRILCAINQDDHVHVVKYSKLSNEVFWCPECHRLWLTLGNLLKKDQMFGVTFTHIDSLGELLGVSDMDEGFIDLGVFELD